MSEEANKPEMASGIVGWNEVITSDLAGSVAFYTELFGWTTEEMPLPDGNVYTMFKNGDRVVGGCVAPSEGSAVQPMWMTYINVEDLDSSVAKAQSLGGTIHMPRVDIPMGSFCVLSDPQGATFAFWQSNPDADC